MKRVACGVIALGVVLLSPPRGRALEDYADAIAATLDLPDKPSCLYCHARNVRGLAVDTPFNNALKDRGFSRRLGIPSLRSALDALEEDRVDSDSDGVIDIDELSAGANPNDPSDRGLPPNDCSISAGRHIASTSWLPLLLSLSWLRLRRLRQARHCRRT